MVKPVIHWYACTAHMCFNINNQYRFTGERFNATHSIIFNNIVSNATPNTDNDECQSSPGQPWLASASSICCCIVGICGQVQKMISAMIKKTIKCDIWCLSWVQGKCYNVIFSLALAARKHQFADLYDLEENSKGDNLLKVTWSYMHQDDIALFAGTSFTHKSITTKDNKSSM